jgi:NaMN:DMB phosphoribosyltransferase
VDATALGNLFDPPLAAGDKVGVRFDAEMLLPDGTTRHATVLVNASTTTDINDAIMAAGEWAVEGHVGRRWGSVAGAELQFIDFVSVLEGGFSNPSITM